MQFKVMLPMFWLKYNVNLCRKVITGKTRKSKINKKVRKECIYLWLPSNWETSGTWGNFCSLAVKSSGLMIAAKLSTFPRFITWTSLFVDLTAQRSGEIVQPRNVGKEGCYVALTSHG